MKNFNEVGGGNIRTSLHLHFILILIGNDVPHCKCEDKLEARCFINWQEGFKNNLIGLFIVMNKP